MPHQQSTHSDSTDSSILTRLTLELLALPLIAVLFLGVITLLPQSPPFPTDVGIIAVAALAIGIVRALYLTLAYAVTRIAARQPALREVFG